MAMLAEDPVQIDTFGDINFEHHYRKKHSPNGRDGA